MARCSVLERDAALPGNEIVLSEQLSFGETIAARHFDRQFENFFSSFGDSHFAADHSAGIEVNDVAHPLGGFGVCGDLHHRSYGVAGGRTEAGGEQHEIGAGAGLSGNALDVVAWRAEEVEPRRGGVLWKIEHVTYG